MPYSEEAFSDAWAAVFLPGAGRSLLKNDVLAKSSQLRGKIVSSN